MAGAFVVFFICSYKSEYKIYLLDWGLGFVLLALCISVSLVKKKISKCNIKSLLLIFSWLPFGLLGFVLLGGGNAFLLKLLKYSLLVSLSIPFLVILFTSDRKREKIFFYISIFWFFSNLPFVIGYFLGEVEYVNGNYFSGVYSNRNEFSLQTAIIYLLYFVHSVERWSRWVLFIAFFSLVIFSQSLSGFLVLVLGLGFFYFLKSDSFGRVKILFLSNLVILTAYFLVPSFTRKLNQIFLVFTNPSSLEVGYSVHHRLWLLLEGARISMSSPFVGFGIGNSKNLLIPKTEEFVSIGMNFGLHSHNNFIETSLNFGIIAAFIHYLPVFMVLLNCKSSRYSNGLKVLALSYVVASFTAIFYDFFIFILLYSIIIYYFIEGTAYEEKNSFSDSSA